MSALFDSGSKVNAIHPTFTKELGLPIRPIDIRAQKIDGTTLHTFGIVVAAFSVTDKANQVRFFEETFLVANISLEIVFEMLFFTLSGSNVNFLGQELRWRIYTTEKTFPTIKYVELVDKKEFAAATLDPEYEIYVIHVRSVSSDALPIFSPFDVYPSQRSQISGLITEEAPTKVPAKYLDFTDLFSPDLASELPEHTRIKNYAIKLVDGQQLLYGSIYSLGPVELKILKTYIETNLANGFIKPSKLPVDASILFNRKSDGFFRLCVNYQGLKNLTIKN